MRLAVKKVGTIFVRFQYFMSLQEDAKDVDVLSCVDQRWDVATLEPHVNLYNRR